MTYNAFNAGTELALGVVDAFDVMADDVNAFRFACLETHRGFWNALVNHYHKLRQELPLTAEQAERFEVAQACYGLVR